MNTKNNNNKIYRHLCIGLTGKRRMMFTKYVMISGRGFWVYNYRGNLTTSRSKAAEYVKKQEDLKIWDYVDFDEDNPYIFTGKCFLKTDFGITLHLTRSRKVFMAPVDTNPEFDFWGYWKNHKDELKAEGFWISKMESLYCKGWYIFKKSDGIVKEFIEEKYKDQ